MQSNALFAIVGMAVVTYLTQVGGLWLISKVTPSPRVAALLRHIPGAVLVAIVAPAVFHAGTRGSECSGGDSAGCDTDEKRAAGDGGGNWSRVGAAPCVSVKR